MDESAGAITARLVVTVTEPDLAVTMVGVAVGVTARAFSSARFPPEAMTVARFVFAVDQATTPVMSRKAPLLKVPVAVMRPTVPLTRVILLFVAEMLSTVRAIEFSVPPVTLRLVDPLTPDRVALIKVVPCARAVAVPPGAIDATPGLPELQTTLLVISGVVPSE
jgi:hypothetical protein